MGSGLDASRFVPICSLVLYLWLGVLYDAQLVKEVVWRGQTFGLQ